MKMYFDKKNVLTTVKDRNIVYYEDSYKLNGHKEFVFSFLSQKLATDGLKPIKFCLKIKFREGQP